MLDEEVIDIIMYELYEFTESYLTMCMITNEELHYVSDSSWSIKVGKWVRGYNDLYIKPEHSIYMESRTRMRFNFCFLRNEKDYAMELTKILDGYVEYKFSVGIKDNKEVYHFSFSLDTGSKHNNFEFFKKLSFLEE